jgi:hypothetical protein
VKRIPTTGGEARGKSWRHRWAVAQPAAFGLFIIILVLTGLGLRFQTGYASLQQQGYLVSGKLSDAQGEPVSGGQITITYVGQQQPLGEAESQEDGSWAVILDKLPTQDVLVKIERPHFKAQTYSLGPQDLEQLQRFGVYRLGTFTLERHIDAGFWIAGLVFLGVLLAIAFEVLHSTTAALAGFSIIFLVSYIGGYFNPNFFIFSLDRGLSYINWEVIFLVMGMMVIIAIIEGTGIFQWMAFRLTARAAEKYGCWC